MKYQNYVLMIIFILNIHLSYYMCKIYLYCLFEKAYLH